MSKSHKASRSVPITARAPSDDDSPPEPSPRPPAPEADARQLLMPASDQGPQHPVGERLATPSGGASGAEDSTRAAGYVADLSAHRVPPPGPPVATDPASLVGPETIPPPPKPADSAATPPPSVEPCPPSAKRSSKTDRRARGRDGTK